MISWTVNSFPIAKFALWLVKTSISIHQTWGTEITLRGIILEIKNSFLFYRTCRMKRKSYFLLCCQCSAVKIYLILKETWILVVQFPAEIIVSLYCLVSTRNSTRKPVILFLNFFFFSGSVIMLFFYRASYLQNNHCEVKKNVSDTTKNRRIFSCKHT